MIGVHACRHMRSAAEAFYQVSDMSGRTQAYVPDQQSSTKIKDTQAMAVCRSTFAAWLIESERLSAMSRPEYTTHVRG